MADFVSSFWSYFVAIGTLLSIGYCIFVLVSNMKGKKSASGEAELHGHVWDGSLAEYNNPLPRWWLYLFWITIVFALVYLALYPGLGSYQGLLQWSSTEGTANAQYTAEMNRAEQRYTPIFAKFTKLPVEQVAADPEANAMGRRLFLTYCIQCHGSAAKGAKGFPNLTDDDWLHGGTPDKIVETIRGGRHGVMPALGEGLGGEATKDVANYVRSLSSLAHDTLRAARGKEVFAMNCATCHSADGHGDQKIGSANLSDKTWLYGSRESSIIETIVNGRDNRMPAFLGHLGEDKVHLLASYVYSLSPKPSK